MKKVTTRIKFLDSNSKEMVSRRLKDACSKVIDEYNNNPTIVSPILKISKYENGDWDTGLKEEPRNLKEVDLNNYSDKEGVLDFEKLFNEFYDFLTEKFKENDSEKKLEVSLEDDYSKETGMKLTERALRSRAVDLFRGKEVRVYLKEDLFKLIDIAEEYEVFNPEHKQVKTPAGIEYIVKAGSRSGEKSLTDSYIDEELAEGETVNTYKEKLKEYNLSIKKLSGNEVRIKGKTQDIIKYYKEEIGVDLEEENIEEEKYLTDEDSPEDETEISEEEINKVVQEVEENDEDEGTKTYKEYFEEQLKVLDKSNFRYYLISIILGKDKGWSYLKSPKDIVGDEFDIVTPKNSKKILKIFKENSK